MARRLGLNQAGMFISDPGQDCFVSAARFHADFANLMQVASGSFNLSGQNFRVEFGVTLVEVPLVICQIISGDFVNFPVSTVANTTGFNTFAEPLAATGAIPALGQSMRWVAFMRGR